MTTSGLPTVLLLHGFGGSAARTWGDNGWLDLLADAGRATIAPDLLGHGSAQMPHDPEAYRDLERSVAALLPFGESVDAIGFSMGARVILTIAAAQPERFRRIVVAGVGENLLRNEPTSVLAAALRDPTPHEHPLARYFQQLAVTTGADPLALAAFLERPDDPVLDPDALRRVTSPVLVVLGDDDFAGPADPLVACLPSGTAVTLSRTDHFSTPKSLAFIDAALDFLAQP